MSLFHRRLAYAVTTAWLIAGSTGVAQSNVRAYRASLAVPFGVAEGHVLLMENSLIFVDSDQPETSFAIPRDAIAEFDRDGDVVSVTTHDPIRDRSGSRREIRVRLAQGDAVARWYAESPGAARAAMSERASTAEEAGAVASYQVKHNHRLGSCEGRLIMTGDRLAFESLTSVDDSRQWAFADLRELRQDGIYKLEVQPFVGNTYDFELIGRGLDSETYRELVDDVAQSRVRP